MEPALKQRLIGAAVLVALAVIFLPMLIKGPAPESGAADVSLDMPNAPQDGMQTRVLPLGEPSTAGANGAVGLDAEPDTLPTVDTTTTTPAATTDDTGMLPASTAGGGYAVSFGSYASVADAERVIAALRKAQLTGYQDAVTARSGRAVQRVRIGPYASEAEAQAARIRAVRVNANVAALVIALDATPPVPMSDPRNATAGVAASASASTPIAVDTPSVSKPTPLASTPAPKPAPLPPSTTKPSTPVATTAPATSTPTPKPVATPAPPAPKPAAAANVGYAVQLGAFGKAEDATKLRDRLRASGFSAFIEDVRTDKGTLSRVRVGPVATRAEADALKSQVAGKTGVSGDVRAHP